MKDEIRICPFCGKKYTGHPAISRKDNDTLICTECGAREALDIFGISEAEKDRIIAAMRGKK